MHASHLYMQTGMFTTYKSSIFSILSHPVLYFHLTLSHWNVFTKHKPVTEQTLEIFALDMVWNVPGDPETPRRCMIAWWKKCTVSGRPCMVATNRRRNLLLFKCLSFQATRLIKFSLLSNHSVGWYYKEWLKANHCVQICCAIHLDSHSVDN